MDKQIAAEKLERSILDRVRGLLMLLPNNITYKNEGMFIKGLAKLQLMLLLKPNL